MFTPQGFLRIFGIASFRAGLLRIRSLSTAYSKHDFRYVRILPTADLLNPFSANSFTSNCRGVSVGSRIL